MSMIVYDCGDRRFNYRTAGIILHRGRVLLQTTEQDDFWVLPGGRVELGEPADRALVRELGEELGVEVAISRLVWAAENFFTYDHRRYHELSFYFLVALPEPEPQIVRRPTFSGTDGGVRLLFQWFPLSELGEVNLKPAFLKQGLRTMPAAPQHIVHEDAAAGDAV